MTEHDFFSNRGLVEQSYQLLDRHLDYWSKIGTKPHQIHMGAFVSTYWETSDSHQLAEQVESFTAHETDLWSRGTTTLLDPDALGLVVQGAEVMPTATLLPEMVPYPNGIVMMPDDGVLLRYESPADLAQGLEYLPIVAIGWEVTDKILHRGPDGDQTDGVALWLYMPTSNFTEGRDAPGAQDILRLGIVAADMIPWAFNSGWVVREESLQGSLDLTWDEDGNLGTDHHVAYARKFVLALWAFMADKIIVDPRQTLPRPLARRVARTPVTADLRILHLRKVVRPDSERDGSSDREWSHRWMVKGHWRKLASGRITWVRGHIRGPGDKPLVLKNDIVAVRR